MFQMNVCRRGVHIDSETRQFPPHRPKVLKYPKNLVVNYIIILFVLLRANKLYMEKRMFYRVLKIPELFFSQKTVIDVTVDSKNLFIFVLLHVFLLSCYYILFVTLRANKLYMEKRMFYRVLSRVFSQNRVFSQITSYRC